MLSLPYEIDCGYFDSLEFGNLTVSPERTVKKFEIEFYTENAFETFVDGKPFQIRKNHILISKPEQKRYSKLPFYTVYLKFKAEGEIAKRLMNAPQYFESSHPERIKEELSEIIMLNENGADELELMGKLLLLVNLILYDSAVPENFSGNNYTVIANSKRYIESHFRENVGLKEIASNSNLSASYFHSVFTSVNGCTPHQYLIKCRISEAKKMLWYSEKSLEEIAEECGFGYQQYFNRIFKKETGISPGNYRKEAKKKYIKSDE